MLTCLKSRPHKVIIFSDKKNVITHKFPICQMDSKVGVVHLITCFYSMDFRRQKWSVKVQMDQGFDEQLLLNVKGREVLEGTD